MDSTADDSTGQPGLDRVRERLRHTSFGDVLADLTRGRRSVQALRRSGLFDRAWYRGQLGGGPGPVLPLRHYVRIGADRCLSPHPLFDPDFYLTHRRLTKRSAATPFVEFLNRGCHRGDDPHPMFSTSAYLRRVPEAATHPHGAFGHFLASDDAPWPSADLLRLGVPDLRGRDRYLALVRRATERHRAEKDHTAFQRSFERFDHARAARFVADMRRVVGGMGHQPTVSVIIPTKDRRDMVRAAIASVQDQTWPHWELVVVDDGGSDGTDQVVTAMAADDDRIHYVHQRNTGVAGARNRGIRASRGELIAYLDSDNTWTPTFLETMVGFLHDQGLRAGYAASELRREGQVEYRGRPLDVDALRERNYIDCITIVHERGLIDDLGGQVFDESLRRVVDWDLLIRLADITDLGYAPFIATSYDVWDEAGDRITNTENPGYRQVVRNKHLVRWDRDDEPTAGGMSVIGRVSVIVVARTPGDRSVTGAIGTIAPLLAEPDLDLEVLVVDNGLEPGQAVRLRAVEELTPRLDVIRLADPVSTVVARNLAASRATGDVLVFVDSCVHLEADGVRRLVEAVHERGALLAQPLVVGADGLVYSTGQVLGDNVSEITVGRGLGVGDPAVSGTTDRDGVDGLVFAIDADTYRRLGGMDPLFVRGASDLDLGLRARNELGVRTMFVREAVAQLAGSRDVARWSPTESDRMEFARRWRDHPTRELADLVDDSVSVDGLVPMPGEASGFPKRWTIHLRPSRTRRRWAIKTSIGDVAVRQTWGDWHFACALRDALNDLGEEAVVDCRPTWHRPTARLDDVNVVLRGLHHFEPPPDKLNLLWVISHPDLLTRYELEQYDQVFVASTTHPDELAARWPGVSATSLLQCTDPSRFHPDPDPSVHEGLLFVGNSRRIMRAVVRDALDAGLEPTIYGSRWEHLIPAQYVKDTYLPNEELRRHYCSADVVLNDHWDDMRTKGFVSNRLFDAVASGARVVSDHIDGLEELFGDRVVTYDGGPDALAAAVAEARSRPRVNPEVVDRVASEHTFAARARSLVEAADRLSGARPPRHLTVVEPADGTPVTAGRQHPPVFVGGTGRSGTTIVGDLIAASRPYTAVPIEVRIHADPGGLPDLIAGRIDIDEFEHRVRTAWYLRRPNNSGPRGLHVVASWTEVERALDRLREGVAAGNVATAAGRFLRDLLDPVADRAGAASWVETTPPVVQAADTLGRAMPSARFVHMIRDARDVAASVLQRGWGPDTMQDALAWWADGMIAIGRATAHLPPNRILHLRLESLVGPDRESAYGRLAAFLGMSDDPDMRAFFDARLSRAQAREGRWKRDRSLDEIADIERWHTQALARLAAEGVELPAA